MNTCSPADVDIDIEIGKRLKHHRLKVGLSCAKVGAHLGITYQQVQKYESGANRVSASTLKRIADYLDVTIDDLFPVSSNFTDALDRSELSAAHFEIAEKIQAIHPDVRGALFRLIAAL